MSRTFFVALAILLSPASVRADVAGCWISAAGNSVIEMHVENDVVTGRIVGMNDPVFLAEEGRGTPGAVRTDLENPEPALRERPLAGLVILENLQRDGRRWDNGSVYDPESGKSYSVRAEVDGDGLLLLEGISAPRSSVARRSGPMQMRALKTPRECWSGRALIYPKERRRRAARSDLTRRRTAFHARPEHSRKYVK